MNEQEYREKLKTQLREAYGRVVYSLTTHSEEKKMIDKKQKYLKIIQMGLDAISMSGIFATIVFDEFLLKVISGIISAVSFGIKLYYKEYNLVEESNQHQTTADELWFIREDYVSLLTDINVKPINEIVVQRSKLQKRTGDVYVSAPKTSDKSYRKAQKTLQLEEVQFFTSDEIDQMLPEHLRENKIDVENFKVIEVSKSNNASNHDEGISKK